MPNRKKHLEFYYQCGVLGRIPEKGLCTCAEWGLVDKEVLELFEPADHEFSDLVLADIDTAYWGSGLNYISDLNTRRYKFTPLRQNIVLFMAAIHGEL